MQVIDIQQLPSQLTRAQFDTNPKQASKEAIGGNDQLNTETERVVNKTTGTIEARWKSVHRLKIKNSIILSLIKSWLILTVQTSYSSKKCSVCW